MNDPEFVWIVTNFGFPAMPRVSRYVFSKKTPSGKGVMVKELGCVRRVGMAEYCTVCWTREEARDLVKSILVERKKRAEEVLKQIAEFDKGIPFEEISPDPSPWTTADLKLD